jgi:hypothetical protein
MVRVEHGDWFTLPEALAQLCSIHGRVGDEPVTDFPSGAGGKRLESGSLGIVRQLFLNSSSAQPSPGACNVESCL